MTTAAATETTTYEALDAEWREAVAARNEHDARVRRIVDGIDVRYDRARETVRRREGAKRAHLTRRIVAAEKAIDALTAPAPGGRCYCPGDCNCRYQDAPWNRTNYCGCRQH